MKRPATAFAMILSGLAIMAQDGAGHFRFSGPLSQFMAPKAEVAPVSMGLPFDVRLGSNGATPETLSIPLKPTGSSGPLSLELAGLKYAAGRLSGTARIRNASGTVVEGVRLDITGATEEYQTKDAKGNPVLNTRMQPASLPSPLFFGDLEKDGASSDLVVDAGTIKFTPGTTSITLHGVVSGLRYLGAFDVKGLENPAAVDVDGKGRVYIGDVDGQRIVRTDAEGRTPEDLIKLPDQCAGVAVDPRSGDVWASRINSKEIYRFSEAGAEKGAVSHEGYASYLRFGRQGRLYASGGHVFCFADQKQAYEAGQAAGEDLYAKGMDVDSAGNIWVVSGLEKDRFLFRIEAGGKRGRRVIAGPDWHLGLLYMPQSVRLDPVGNVYVIEQGEEGAEAARISVFDQSGRFLRVFGRGGPVPVVDGVLPGQVWRPVDLAFGSGGRLYVACANDGGFSRHLMLMFQPF